MRHISERASLPAAALAAFLLASPLAAKPCDLEPMPAATLLIPYFEISNAALVPPYGQPDVTTAFTIVNIASSYRVAHVTLWTDWAIPTASFDVALGPLDVASVNLADVFRGDLPDSSPGPDQCVAFPPGALRLNPALNPVSDPLERLRRAHTGEQIPVPGNAMVASSLHPDAAIGYVTVDAVRDCTDKFPSSPGYFKDKGAGIATNDNVLAGDWTFVDFADGTGFFEPAVHVRADPAFGAVYTFYARYVKGEGTDDRQPLGVVWATRQISGGVLVEPSTDLIVWRDTKTPAVELRPAGTTPPWAPLELDRRISSCDEAGHCAPRTASLPLATQRVRVGSGNLPLPPGHEVGWLRLWFFSPPGAGGPILGSHGGQAFVTTVVRTTRPGGTAVGGMRAIRVSSACGY